MKWSKWYIILARVAEGDDKALAEGKATVKAGNCPRLPEWERHNQGEINGDLQLDRCAGEGRWPDSLYASQYREDAAKLAANGL